MKKRRNPEFPDADNPEWTPATVARAKRMNTLPKTLRRKLRGRPVVGSPKTAISLRMPKDVLARWRASGPGWQTRMAETLAKRAP
ncbi:MAG: BrnA antitoxin family protein [Gammaproteobacteria bacterium]|nr:BrnA antitoxin family protein [Gammaproteobacteria bacterium]MBU6509376.1 BrnA antitoxin family protein [Gammaproteobacteria bacterium]MDE1984707.1 BrnA antitoxin family protein [Gammaproteobacteria bacterium]MDE2107684.1 BrnA antitoxin family protein [Gammaproteobacteria bacterium]MDE2460849.1 BrnA antitoxin family protein [Gammaproteobacteria bacterium]